MTNEQLWYNWNSRAGAVNTKPDLTDPFLIEAKADG